MPAIPHPVRGWWRYSKLTFIPFGTTGILIVLLGILALIRYDVIKATLTGALTVLWLGYLGWGAVNAERARRHGCW